MLPQNQSQEVKSTQGDHHDGEFEEIEKQSKPMLLTNSYVDKTNLMCLVTVSLFGLSFLLVAAFGIFQMSPQEGRSFLIWNDSKVQTMDIWQQMQEDFQDFQESLITIPERSQIEYYYTTHIIFECDGCSDNNVLTAENFKVLYEIEQKILGLENYKNFCLASSASTDCSDHAFISLTQEFEDPANVTEEQLQALLQRIQTDEGLFTQYKTLIGDDFKFQGTQQKSKLFRTLMNFGNPIMVDGKLKADEGEDKDDFEDKQKKKFEDWSQELMNTSRAVKEPKNVKIIEYSPIINKLETGDITMKDFLLIGFSVAFVLIYMTFHLKSLFLSSLAMVNIVMSFPITLLIFRGIFQITYFSDLHILAIFIVLGIAADDVFVFIDAWDQSEKLKQLEGNYNKRMAYTFRRAANAMLATSSTTSVCFFATGMSEIMPLASFGIFAGILVPVNYGLVITAFPIFIMFYEYKFKEFQWPCVKFVQSLLSKQQKGEEKQKNESKIELFFEKTWTEFTNKYRLYILIGFAIWIGIAAWQSTKLAPIKEQEEFLPDSLETIYAADLVKDGFHLSHADRSVTLNIYYFIGTKDIDRSGISRWDAETVGKVEWDNDFDLSPKANQQWLYDFCVNTKSHKLVLDEQVSCFMPSFKQFVEQVKLLAFPVEQNQFQALLEEYSKTAIGQYYFHRNDIGIIDGNLKYIIIQMIGVGAPMGGYEILNPQYEEWEEFRKQQQNNAPEGLKSHKQTALTPWVWMPTERAFVSNALEGILVSIGFSFIVLLLTSHNIITSFFSLLSIVGVIFSVITVMVLAGYELGVSESIALVIIIGLSVDYVVHLANHYIESVAYHKRYDKVRVSLKEIGISIVSGAITTIGSGLFLLLATTLIFNKFAVLIIATISFAVLFSLGFFISLLHQFGPIDGAGDLKNCISKVFPSLCNKKEQQQSGKKSLDTETNGCLKEKKNTYIEQEKQQNNRDIVQDKVQNKNIEVNCQQ